jgi:uncharacterized membrane protein YdjX (TVP38/TMEM64 family)
MKQARLQTVFRILSAAGFLLSIALCIYGWKLGIFSSQHTLQSFISGFGIAGPVVFIVFQAVQVVIPVLPGGVSCLAGVFLFGAWQGFLYNYIGICIGSILAFLVAKYYGKPVLRCFFREKRIEKYTKWTSEKSRFPKLFAIAIFLPVAPDDLLCYLAGTTDMSLRQFVCIILLGKPFSIALYSMGLMLLSGRIAALLGGSI